MNENYQPNCQVQFQIVKMASHSNDTPATSNLQKASRCATFVRNDDSRRIPIKF
jgi:hypothetical protein